MKTRNPLTARRSISRAKRVEMQFLERVRTRCPSYRLVKEALGELYTQTGRFEEGLEVDLALTSEHPHDPHVWYNLGCSFALVGRKDEAFDALQRAVGLGYRDFDWMRKDSNLELLRSDARFRSLLRQFAS
ncbi:MAG: hypothetical protein NTV49_01180 [Kiritimatiellaeota bacterium]|nr:hypothetical protein [Kiritimatiellota bacterium]